MFEPLTRFVEETVAKERGESSLTQIWNVNLPATNPVPDYAPQVCFCPVDQKPLKRKASTEEPTQDKPDPNKPSTMPMRRMIKLQSDFHGRPRVAGTDVDRCFSGNLTISLVAPGLNSAASKF
jgi:5'-nucleotidase